MDMERILPEARSWRELACKALLTGWREPGDPFIVPVRGSGARVWSDDGREFLDLGSQSMNLNLGHFPTAAQVLATARHGFVSQKTGGAPEAIVLAVRLASLAGMDGGRVHFTTSGALAIEAALRLARQATGRGRFLSLRCSFHGGTSATLALAGWEGLDRWAGSASRDVALPFAEPAYCFRCAWGLSPESCAAHCGEELARRVLDLGDALAAVVAEPIVSNQAIVPPADFWKPVREACDRTGALLIFDEVVTGLGRTGRWWAKDWFGVRPDIIALGKGLNAGIAPLGAMIASGEVVERLEGAFLFGQTDEAHPLCCRVGAAVLDELERGDLPARAARMGVILGDRLSRLKAESPLVADVRGVGLLWGVELDAGRLPDASLAENLAAIRRRAIEEGLLLGSWGRTILIAPPLVIEEEDLLEGVDRLARALEREGAS
jgi:4-aminobutyrate aminotransferase-like enzyme